MANRLGREKSPYLKQHAANPIDWYPWGDEAFAKAQAEDKPIFLSIGYSSCHWCHVMARESFSDDEVAAVVNERFVAIKVDREERPDIDALYMAACQALGNPGGWPLSVFLTPSGKPFFAGTYFPKRARGATPGFIELVSSIARLWQADRARIDATGDQLTEHLSAREVPAGQSPPDEGIFTAVYRALRNQFDDRHGGFGQAPKFPVPHRLSFLFSYHRSTGNDAALRMAAETLRHMRHGGVFDQIGLGFHRYSVDERWRVPHFEKMLADQALCAYAYIEAFLVTQDPFYARTAHEIFAYVLRDMTADTGGFFTAQDADSGSEEGATYLFETDEIRRVLKNGEADLAVEYFGIKREGNIPVSGFADGMNIPYVPVEPEQVAARRGMETAKLLDAVESIRQRLLEARSKRPQPGTDDKRITAVNGLMIGALALGYRALGEPAYLAAAERAARFVFERLSDGTGGLLRRFREDTAGIGGFLDDYAFFIRGLIELYEASLDVDFLDRALALCRVMLERFEDPRGGGLFTAPRDGERLIADVKEVLDGAGPSPNAVAAENLLRLAALSGNTGFFDAAEAILKDVWPLISAHPEAATGYMAAYRRYLGPTSQIVIVGTPGSDSAREMVQTVHGLFLPAASLLFVPQRGRARRRVEKIAPFVSGMAAADGRAAAYICRDHTCREPLTDPGSVRAALLGAV